MNEYRDKYISILGDSISTYEGYLPSGYESYYSRHDASYTGIYGYRETWWGRVIFELGARLLVNNSYSGSCVCLPRGGDDAFCASGRARTSLLACGEDAPDHIIVYMGTNDRGAGFNLTSDDACDLSAFENAYRTMLRRVRENYPSAVIHCCTLPITTVPSDPSFVFESTAFGARSPSFCKMIRTVALSEGCSLIDLTSGSPVETLDGLHPNYNGMMTLAERVLIALRAVY